MAGWTDAHLSDKPFQLNRMMYADSIHGTVYSIHKKRLGIVGDEKQSCDTEADE